tara:strand:- start:241 stop:1248 length:1008 start_codon:yes stop_codon:yes gene_type:complete
MKICVVRIDKMGDMLLTLPVIQGLKKANEKNIIDVVCSDNNFRVCKNISVINNIFLLNKKISNIWKNIRNIRKQNYDYLYSFSPGWKSIVISILSKSKTKSILILQSRYKSGKFSKLIERILCKLFFNNIKVVDRNLYFRQNKSINQSRLMQKLVTQSGLQLLESEEIKNLFQFDKKNYGQKKICLIHLSSKWINRYFLEDQFINLLDKFKNTGINIVMSSDQSSREVFNKIYEKYKKISNDAFDNIKDISEILILEELNFHNWTSIINSSSYVITPECGCTHIASLTNCKLCVIYDADNLPDMIAQEYTPWKKNYTKLKSNDDNLEEKLISFIN